MGSATGQETPSGDEGGELMITLDAHDGDLGMSGKDLN
jgi:hypothetical protein